MEKKSRMQILKEAALNIFLAMRMRGEIKNSINQVLIQSKADLIKSGGKKNGKERK